MNSYLWIRAMISSSATFVACSNSFEAANPEVAGASPYKQDESNVNGDIENCHVIVLKSVAFEESCDNKENIERPKMEIKIRKEALSLVGSEASFWQREIERKNNHSKGDSSGSAATKESSNDLTIEIDLDDLVKKIFVNDQMYYVSELEEQKHIREVIKELTVIFEFIINENNWKNEEIIKKPDYTTKILSYSVLRTIIEVFASSNPDKKSWCRLFSHLRNTLFNLSVDDFDVIVSTLIPRLAYLITFPKPVDNLQDINMTVFFNSFETFCELFCDNNKFIQMRKLTAYFSAKCRRPFNFFARSSQNLSHSSLNSFRISYFIENAPTSSKRNNLESPFENSCSDIRFYIIRKPQLFDVSFVTNCDNPIPA